MDLFAVLHIGIALVTLTLGLLVYLTNRRRSSNAAFLFLCIVVVTWLTSLGVAFRSTNTQFAALAIQAANALGAMMPFAFNAMRLSILFQTRPASVIIRHSLVWIISAVAVGAMCFTPFFLRSVVLGVDGGIPEPIYGPGILIFAASQVAFHGFFIWRFVVNLRSERGIARVELQFVLLASAVAIVSAILLGTVLPFLLKSFLTVRLAPLSALLFTGIIAYGIATRRILDVGSVLRMITAYTLLGIYLTLLYAAVLFTSAFVFRAAGFASDHVPHFLAALALAASLAPAYGRMQNVANRLFVGVATTDVGRTVRRTSAVLQSIGTLDALLARLASVTLESVGAGDMTILLEEKGRFRQVFPRNIDNQRIPGGVLEAESAVARVLTASPQPIILDVINRRQPTPLLAAAGSELESMGSAAAIGVRSKSGLQGIMLLGPRLSGRVYGLLEQRALQHVADQLAVAIENARLYTQLQDSKIYNEILLDNLVSGVVAADSEGRITVFNREAGRITQLEPAAMIGANVSTLPHELRVVIDSTLTAGTGSAHRDVRISVGNDEETIPIQVASSLFHGHEGAVSGALLVFSDLSQVKKLETQVRRTAHLASVGTLSAGMAHEIKNPLVTLKTFAQLLSEQYEDPEFRDTFSDLVGQEVDRIDRIVNQLLKFGRPAKAEMVTMSLREVIEHSLQLVGVPMRKKNVDLKVAWRTQTSTTAGDPRLLEQAFVNFFLNAIDAMESGGELEVSLRMIRESLPGSEHDEDVLPDRHLSVSIRDSGTGIAEESLPHVFDPFFTTKSTGTGLGLSVVHSIIQEHGGMIDVESAVGQGTTFHVLLPVRRRAEVVSSDRGSESSPENAAGRGAKQRTQE
jgi:PAS domain S-box-containing protein